MQLYVKRSELPKSCHECDYFDTDDIQSSDMPTVGYCRLMLDDSTGRPDGIPQNEEQAKGKADCPLLPMESAC